MIITKAKYINDPYTGELNVINAEIDGETMSVPLSEGNSHYAEIMRQVDAGELTIEPADE